MQKTTKNRRSIATLITDRIDELKGVRNQKEIADMVGYPNPNVVTMLKNNTAKLAIDRVPEMARALEVDPALLMRLALEQFYEKTTVQMLENTFRTMSRAEAEVIEIFRDETDDKDLKINEGQKNDLRKIFNIRPDG
jgi:hypothetical protein